MKRYSLSEELEHEVFCLGERLKEAREEFEHAKWKAKTARKLEEALQKEKTRNSPKRRSNFIGDNK